MDLEEIFNFGDTDEKYRVLPWHKRVWYGKIKPSLALPVPSKIYLRDWRLGLMRTSCQVRSPPPFPRVTTRWGRARCTQLTGVARPGDPQLHTALHLRLRLRERAIRSLLSPPGAGTGADAVQGAYVSLRAELRTLLCTDFLHGATDAAMTLYIHKNSHTGSSDQSPPSRQQQAAKPEAKAATAQRTDCGLRAWGDMFLPGVPSGYGSTASSGVCGRGGERELGLLLRHAAVQFSLQPRQPPEPCGPHPSIRCAPTPTPTRWLICSHDVVFLVLASQAERQRRRGTCVT